MAFPRPIGQEIGGALPHLSSLRSPSGRPGSERIRLENAGTRGEMTLEPKSRGSLTGRGPPLGARWGHESWLVIVKGSFNACGRGSAATKAHIQESIGAACLIPAQATVPKDRPDKELAQQRAHVSWARPARLPIVVLSGRKPRSQLRPSGPSCQLTAGDSSTAYRARVTRLPRLGSPARNTADR